MGLIMTAEVYKFKPRVDEPSRHLFFCSNCNSSSFKLIREAEGSPAIPECLNCEDKFYGLEIHERD